MRKINPVKSVKAWARVYDGKIERECLDTYGLYTTRAAARANWWGEPGEFIRVEIRPVEKVKKEITK